MCTWVFWGWHATRNWRRVYGKQRTKEKPDLIVHKLVQLQKRSIHYWLQLKMLKNLSKVFLCTKRNKVFKSMLLSQSNIFQLLCPIIYNVELIIFSSSVDATTDSNFSILTSHVMSYFRSFYMVSIFFVTWNAQTSTHLVLTLMAVRLLVKVWYCWMHVCSHSMLHGGWMFFYIVTIMNSIKCFTRIRSIFYCYLWVFNDLAYYWVYSIVRVFGPVYGN